MTDQERDELDQAHRELRARCDELSRQGLAKPHDLARMIDELHAQMIARFTTPQKGAR